MKILYKPFALIMGLIGAKLGQSVFKSLWMQLDDSEPPKPTTSEVSAGKVVGAAALEAATIAGVAALVDRYGAKAWEYLTGVWPGEQRPEPLDPD
jgi:hypothetical protein